MLANTRAVQCVRKTSNMRDCDALFSSVTSFFFRKKNKKYYWHAQPTLQATYGIHDASFIHRCHFWLNRLGKAERNGRSSCNGGVFYSFQNTIILKGNAHELKQIKRGGHAR